MKLEISNVDEMIEGSDLVRSKIATDARSGRSSLFYIIKTTKTPKYKNNIRKNEEAVAMVIGPRSIKRKKKRKKILLFSPSIFMTPFRLPFLMFLFRRTLSLEVKKKNL